MSPDPTQVAHATLLGLSLGLSGCASTGGDLRLYDVGSNEVKILDTGVPFSGGGSETMFLISPYRDRPIEERIEIAKASLKRDGNCRLATEDPDVLRRLTARHTDGQNEQLLMAPITC